MMRVVLRGATSLWLVFLVALGARLSFAWNQERKIPYDVLAPASFAQETGSIASALAVVARGSNWRRHYPFLWGRVHQ